MCHFGAAVPPKLQATPTKVRLGEPSVGWAVGGAREILKGQVQPSPKKVETTMMHQAMVALLFTAIVMFPCFFSAAAGE